MKRIVAIVVLALLAVAPAAEAPAPDLQVLKIGVIPAAARDDGGTYCVEGAWRILEVGQTRWGVLPMAGYPNGVRVQVTVTEWNR